MRSDAFGRLRKILNLFEIFENRSLKIIRYSKFLSSFGGAGTKRTLKLTSASNFAADTPTFRLNINTYTCILIRTLVFDVANDVFEVENIVFDVENDAFDVENVVFDVVNVVFDVENVVFDVESVVFDVENDVFDVENRCTY